MKIELTPEDICAIGDVLSRLEQERQSKLLGVIRELIPQVVSVFQGSGGPLDDLFGRGPQEEPPPESSQVPGEMRDYIYRTIFGVTPGEILQGKDPVDHPFWLFLRTARRYFRVTLQEAAVWAPIPPTTPGISGVDWEKIERNLNYVESTVEQVTRILRGFLVPLPGFTREGIVVAVLRDIVEDGDEDMAARFCCYPQSVANYLGSPDFRVFVYREGVSKDVRDLGEAFFREFYRDPPSDPVGN